MCSTMPKNINGIAPVDEKKIAAESKYQSIIFLGSQHKNPVFAMQLWSLECDHVVNCFVKNEHSQTETWKKNTENKRINLMMPLKSKLAHQISFKRKGKKDDIEFSCLT